MTESQRPKAEREAKSKEGEKGGSSRPASESKRPARDSTREKKGSERGGRPQRGRSGSDSRGGRRPYVARTLPDLPPLPPWLPPDDPSRFENYDLHPAVREGIAAAGYDECTEVQAKVLPIALQGKDVAAQSQTGTGKTAAFLITTFCRLLWRGTENSPGPRALIIAPTRELTVQIVNDAMLLGGSTGLKIGVAFGGVDYDKQRQALLDGVDVLVGTPGRLIDYLKQGVWSPDGVEALIIDEADRMLDMGFIKDLRFMLRRLPPYDRRLSMLFSATMSWRAQELTYEYMDLPVAVKATPEKITAEKVEEMLYHVDRKEKAGLLLGLMEREEWERMLIFTNMKIEAEKVERLLVHHGIRARAITGNLEQTTRLRLMEEFKSGELKMMVATDVASRGLHIEGVSHVINWDLPQDPEDYIHRIGRTARAGATGKAISLADEESVYNLEAIEKMKGKQIPVIWHTGKDLAEVKSGWVRRKHSSRPAPDTRRGRPSGPGGRRGGSGGGSGGSSGSSGSGGRRRRS